MATNRLSKQLMTLPQLIKTTKQNMGLNDLPEVITDKELTERLQDSTLPIFSSIYPRKVKFILTDAMVANQGYNYMEYRIPSYIYEGASIIDIQDVDIKPVDGFGDAYISSPVMSSIDDAFNYISSVKLQADLAASLTHSITKQFVAPDLLRIYNGYVGCPYEVRANLTHDINLSTIPQTAILSFQQLFELDVKEFLYNKFKRKRRINTGIGEIELEIDEWRDAIQEKKDLVKEWSNTSVFNYQGVRFFN